MLPSLNYDPSFKSPTFTNSRVPSTTHPINTPGELTDKAFQPTAPVAAATTAAATKPAVGGGLVSNGKTFSLEEIAKHEEDDDLWIVVNNRVYDATEYLEEHPGGADSITMNGGGRARV